MYRTVGETYRYVRIPADPSLLKFRYSLGFRVPPPTIPRQLFLSSSCSRQPISLDRRITPAVRDPKPADKPESSALIGPDRASRRANAARTFDLTHLSLKFQSPRMMISTFARAYCSAAVAPHQRPSLRLGAAKLSTPAAALRLAIPAHCLARRKFQVKHTSEVCRQRTRCLGVRTCAV